MIETDNFLKVEITHKDQLRAWLEKNHAQTDSVWLVTYKKEIAQKYVSTSEVLDELLCFGWIDGIRRKLDNKKTMQLISPRRVQHWTKTYKDRFAKLEQLGLVHESGFQSVKVSKENGLWDYMDDVDALTKPQDLIECMNKYPESMANFDSINASSKRFMLRYIKIAKTPETRNKRILEITLLAQNGEKLKGS